MKTISHDKLLVRLSERALRFRRRGYTESEREAFLDKETWDDTDSVRMKGLVDPIETNGDKETEQQQLEEFGTVGR